MKNNVNQFEEEKHECTVNREGDWVVFRCPICQDYERRIHLVTGKMVSNKTLNPINHSGLWTAIGLQPELYNPS